MRQVMLIIFLVFCYGFWVMYANQRLGKLESQISISRDHERRLAIECELNKYEMSVLTEAIKKEK